MTTIGLDCRDIIHAIERHDGSASTTEIRRETGLDNSSVRYRFRKLEELGLIATERDPTATPEGVAPITIAKLTDDAREEIQKGLIVESKRQRAKIEPADNAESIKELKEELAQLRDRVHLLQSNQNWIGPRVEELVEDHHE
ncbi:helix-turn-helix domain-containing protein [Natribaculum luteum]|uniref:Helix-turn-helix domain-containing protein n=1 Tax=Natribaculum luteum TaxID=1586232 RepID=A0ABD5P281_9EURY|nr:winged helix-turn-helix domain-containing protein [Natribaculum luteum]